MSAPTRPPIAEDTELDSARIEDELALALKDPLSLDDRDDLDVFVPSIPAPTFFQLARHLHSEGRLDLLFPHATADQLTATLDLGAWDGDQLDVIKVREWCTAIVTTYEAAPRGALARLVTAMDPELWTYAVLPGTAIHELDPDDEDARDLAFQDLPGLFTYETPDGVFALSMPDDPFGRAAARIVDAIYHDDLALGRELIVATRAALASAVEEDLLRWRSGRLADLGFVPWEEAMKLLRPLPREQALARRGVAPPASAPAASPPPATIPKSARLLHAVFSRLDPAEQGLRARELALLANELISAQRLPPGELVAQERVLGQAHATLTLALELLAPACPEGHDREAFLAERLIALGLRDLFRVGYGALDKVRAAALALHRGGRVSLAAVGSLLDRPWGPALAALCQRLPALALEGNSAGTRPIAGLADLARATARVGEAGALAALAFDPRGFALDPAWINRVDDPSGLALGDLIRTALIHSRLPGGRGPLAPLIADDLLWARQSLLEAGQLRPELAAELRERCAAIGAPEHAPVLGDILLPRLAVELAGLELDQEGRPDLRRVSALLTVQRVAVWLRTGLDRADP
ncbi:MAG: hypothetical protein IPK80_23480 [Nannocystis sp.]|nr:hypothetical protein [Nannocystis sp.]